MKLRSERETPFTFYSHTPREPRGQSQFYRRFVDDSLPYLLQMRFRHHNKPFRTAHPISLTLNFHIFQDMLDTSFSVFLKQLHRSL